MTSEQYLNLNRNVLLSATATERAVMMVVGLVSGCLSGVGAKLRNISAACARVVLALGIVCVEGAVGSGAFQEQFSHGSWRAKLFL